MLKPLRVHGHQWIFTTGLQIFLSSSQDFGDVNMVVKMAHFYKSSRPQWVNQKYGRSRDDRFLT